MSLALDQIIGSAMLVVIILAVTDKNNMNIPNFMAPIMIGMGLTAIHLRYLLTLSTCLTTLLLQSWPDCRQCS